jgi:hypothetical protein
VIPTLFSKLGLVRSSRLQLVAYYGSYLRFALTPYVSTDFPIPFKRSRTCPFVTIQCTSETSPDCVSPCKILHGWTSPKYVRVRTPIRLSGTKRGEAVHKLPCRIRELRR